MRRVSVLALAALLLPLFVPLQADEGMFPVTELTRMNLRARRLRLPAAAIYNPGGTALVDAIVQVGGCTGSFVSPEGLVLTNHHCAFGAVQAASTKEQDYLTNGFLANGRDSEIPARGLTAQIAQSYKDVSADVLSGLDDSAPPAERSRAIDRRMKEIALEAERANPGKRADVSEMFAGKAYVLTVSAIFRDVRLVYVPHRAIGEFGGEDDNWMWPRHTGDFSFMRVYVGPGGEPADFDTANRPYQPKTYLKVNPRGTREGDPVFLLGYPGRTFRHRSSHHLAFEQQVRMPYIADVYEAQIATMERAGRDDRAVSLKLDARIKGQANVMKNYRGKLAGVRRTSLIEARQADERALQEFIDADPARRARAGTLLSDIAAVHDDLRATAPQDLLLETLTTTSTLLTTALTIEAAGAERARPDAERETRFMDRNLVATRAALGRALANYHPPTDRALLEERLEAALALPPGQRLAELDSWLAGRSLDAALDAVYANTRLTDPGTASELFDRTRDALAQVDDPALDLARALEPAFDAARSRRERRDGTLSRLWPTFVEMKAARDKASFVPDANRTLRVSFATVKGYTPKDGLLARPFTTLAGLVEKASGEAPYYNPPSTLIDAAKKKDGGTFVHPTLGDVPVAFIYDADTTGGNSGSPVLNARGELVGLNFDRAWEATINDFAWSPELSRSIGVDIRYVLWVAQKVGGATWLLAEMGVR